MQQALADCNESLHLDGNDPDALASRGFTYLKLGQLADAIVNYDAALKVAPRHASSLYGRGVVKLRQGDVERGNADIATATAIQADIADQFARYGVAPVAERAPGPATPAQSAAKPAGRARRRGSAEPGDIGSKRGKPAGTPSPRERRARRHRLKARQSRLGTARARRLTGRASRNSSRSRLTKITSRVSQIANLLR